MTALAAEKFIKRIVGDSELRTTLYSLENYCDRMQHIHSEGYAFAYRDFEDGINHLKLLSPTQDQADLLDEIYMWWQLINQDRDEEDEELSTSCSPSACSTCSTCMH